MPYSSVSVPDAMSYRACTAGEDPGEASVTEVLVLLHPLFYGAYSLSLLDLVLRELNPLVHFEFVRFPDGSTRVDYPVLSTVDIEAVEWSCEYYSGCAAPTHRTELLKMLSNLNLAALPDVTNAPKFSARNVA